MPAPAVGIDLGTTNSVVAVSLAGRPQVLTDGNHGPLIPSVVSFLESGERLVGRAARVRRAIDPANTVASVKRLLGRPFKSEEVRRARSRVAFDLKEGPDSSVLVATRGGDFSLPEVSAMILREVRRVAEQGMSQRIDRCVVTVPANFNELQRSSTKIAGRIAELEVIRILNEPTAAALAYGYGRGTREKICIYDFGGGTFDVTLLELAGNVFEVLATAGDTFLGGDDLDTALTDWLVPHLVRTTKIDALQDRVAYDILRDAAESAKCALSTQEATTAEFVYQPRGAREPVRFLHRITRAELERLAAPFVSRTFDVCSEALKLAGLKPSDLTAVILVGGSTRIPTVRQRVASFFGRDPLTNLQPEEVVALGAGILAEALTGGARRVTTRQGASQAPPTTSATASTAPSMAPQQGATQSARPAVAANVPAEGSSPNSAFRGGTLAGVAPQPPSAAPTAGTASRSMPPPVPAEAMGRPSALPAQPPSAAPAPPSGGSAGDFDLDDPFAGRAKPLTSRAPTPLPMFAKGKQTGQGATLDKLDDPSFMGKLPPPAEAPAPPEATPPGTPAPPPRRALRTGEHPVFNLDESSVVTPMPVKIPTITGNVPTPVQPATPPGPEAPPPLSAPPPVAPAGLSLSASGAGPSGEAAELPSVVPDFSGGAALPIIARPSGPPPVRAPSPPSLPPSLPSSPPGERPSASPPERVSSPGVPLANVIGPPKAASGPKPPIGAPPTKPPIGAPPRPSFPALEPVIPNAASASQAPSRPSPPAVSPPESERPSLGLSAAAVASLPPSIAAAISPPPSLGLSAAAAASLPPSIAAAISPPPVANPSPPAATPSASAGPPRIPTPPAPTAPPTAPPLIAPMFPSLDDDARDATREVSVPSFQLDDTLFPAGEASPAIPEATRDVSVPSFRIDADDIFGGAAETGSSTLIAKTPSFDDILQRDPIEPRTTIMNAVPPPAGPPPASPSLPSFAPAPAPSPFAPAPSNAPPVAFTPELPSLEDDPPLVVPPPLGAGVHRPSSAPPSPLMAPDPTSTIQMPSPSARPGLPPAPGGPSSRPNAPSAPPLDTASAPPSALRSAPPASATSSGVPMAPLLLDVTPFSLGVETAGGLCEPVIRRNSTIPVEQTRVFATTNDDQESVIIRIAQGESRRFVDNQALGELELAGLRKAPRGDVSIAVTFELEADGTLKVRARDVETGREQAIRVTLLTLPSEAQQAEMAARTRTNASAAA